jgi:hypothetical protein
VALPRVEMDERGLYELLESETGPVGRDILRRTLAVEAATVMYCPVDEGRAWATIEHEVGRDEGGLYGRVGSNLDYFIHIERGTGLFEETIPGVAPSANKGRRITAKDGGMLRFEIGGQVIYRRSIKGMRPHAPLRRGLDHAED